MDEGVPGHVRDFLTGKVRSLMTLELLLQVARGGPDRGWTPGEAGRELRCAPVWAEAEMRRLAHLGLLHLEEGSPPRFGLAPDAVPGPLAWLLAGYPELRYSIIQVMYPAPGGPVQSFTDAFRLRKERPDG